MDVRHQFYVLYAEWTSTYHRMVDPNGKHHEICNSGLHLVQNGALQLIF